MLKPVLRRVVPGALWRRLQQLKPAALGFVEGRPVLRRGLDGCLDAADSLLGRGDPLRPPRRLIRAIGSDYAETGARFVGHFIRLCDLKPHEAVLDVGCGAGRMAVALAGYLAPPGRYDGFDVMADCVRWCARRVTPRHPHFRFRHVDLFNRHYNPRGRLRASEFRFPYDGAAFDFAFLTSVFTHLLPADADHYLSEVARVLRPGGRLLATFFLLNPESRRAVAEGRAQQPFREQASYATTDPAAPEAAVALPEEFVRAALARHGLASWLVQYGGWAGRAGAPEYQDLLVAGKGPPR